ncbi:MAG TPA: sigma-70 family RNA polymerase sigma factor [Kiritimatiellia bacterium]|nr:sigma-70 family RNA polymerase sigma factor [Kiritimatiellia bacterium]HMP00171.1 sigma-70 family RNA polymerase sigma factor [Kiritimatiellia bacterium]HMP96804.1 sigma-70 family RNA polymerase sigma factor [Kiritimatiellia bacterium]
MELVTDEQAVRRAAVDPEAWVDAHGDYLFRYALLRLQDREAARDAVQETFLAGIGSLARYDGRVEVKHWLRGILRFKIVDRIRKQAREVVIDPVEDQPILESLLFKASGIASMRPDPWRFAPGEVLDREEFWPVFESCLTALPEAMRQAFVLKTVDELSSDEVCKVLNISPNHLWVLNHRARERLKKCIESKWLKPGQ